MQQITWAEFESVVLAVGTIVDVQPFPEAHKPAYKLLVDFGSGIGQLKSSAQITHKYSISDLMHKQVVGVVNFPSKQIGPFISECLITGFQTESGVVLAVPEQLVPNGSRLS